MELVVDDRHSGTKETTWLNGNRLASLPPLRLKRPRRLVVVAPHPDDEVLAAGGLLQYMHRLGVDSTVVAVTDGEASHPEASALGLDIAATRALETQIALQRLGCSSVRVERLGFPDGGVTTRVQDLASSLSGLLGPDDLCLTPWRLDGHPDHDATGRATVAAARATHTPVLEYMVWTWHWATPDTAAVPWYRCRRLDLSRRQAARKRWATSAFSSQIRPCAWGGGREAVLPAPVLRRFWRPFEVFLEEPS